MSYGTVVLHYSRTLFIATIYHVRLQLIHLSSYRFEAHVEIHVGFIDEEDDEQWIEHMLEYVAFLGSITSGKKRICCVSFAEVFVYTQQ